MPDKPRILCVDPQMPDDDLVSITAGQLEKGGIVVFPTSTFYGLGASAFEPNALRRVYTAKKRPAEKPLLVLIANMEQLSTLVKEVPKGAEPLIRAFWPGQVTMVFEADPGLSPLLTAHSGKIGIRLAAHPVAIALLRKFSDPVCGTSANLSGATACTAVSELDERFKNEVDVILDAGPLGGGFPSTVVDVTAEPVKVIREGIITAKQIRATS